MNRVSPNLNFNCNVTEPIGSVSPKVHDGDKTGYMLRERGKPISLLCPAQAYPTPIFRYETGFPSLSFEARPLSLTLWHSLNLIWMTNCFSFGQNLLARSVPKFRSATTSSIWKWSPANTSTCCARRKPIQPRCLGAFMMFLFSFSKRAHFRW